MLIPYQSLATDVLLAVAEEFVSRDGTDYGEHELTMEQKVDELLAKIRAGAVVIVFDETSESVNLLPAEQYESMPSEADDV
jgi:uncharacterized protein YheU (UPF0270 family)